MISLWTIPNNLSRRLRFFWHHDILCYFPTPLKQFYNFSKNFNQECGTYNIAKQYMLKIYEKSLTSVLQMRKREIHQ